MDDITQMMYRITSLGRSIDPRYPSNVAIVIASAAAGFVMLLAGLLAEGRPLPDAALQGLLTALVVFGGWVLGRELDPDNGASAFIAAALTFAGVIAFGPSGLLVLFALVPLVRLVNRTTGLPAKIADYVLILGATGLVVFTTNWFFGLAALLALLLDATLEDGKPLSLGAAVVVAVIQGVAVLVNGFPPLQLAGLTIPVLVLVIVTVILFALGIMTMSRLASPCDATGEPLNVTRIQAGMGVALLMALFTIWGGGPEVIQQYPLWFTLLAVGIYRVQYLTGS